MSSLFLQENLRILKSKYPNQMEYLWNKIETSFHFSILKGGDPAFILFVSDNKTLQKSMDLPFDVLNAIYAASNEKFIKRSTTLDGELSSLVVNTSQMKEQDPAKVKLEIDNKIVSIFSQQGKVALVNEIKNIPSESMMIFFFYGDIGSAAEYPGIVILMTLHVDAQIIFKTDLELNKYIKNYLLNLWSTGIKDNKKMPLMARIGNNILYLV